MNVWFPRRHACKGFVDFGVLFAFGTVNAGVRLDGAGAYSAVVFLSLLVGKTAGLVLGSQAATACGYPRPAGMSFRALVVDGVISSVGLTVSLFIAGEAFPDDPGARDQAKCGALASLAVWKPTTGSDRTDKPRNSPRSLKTRSFRLVP